MVDGVDENGDLYIIAPGENGAYEFAVHRKDIDNSPEFQEAETYLVAGEIKLKDIVELCRANSDKDIIMSIDGKQVLRDEFLKVLDSIKLSVIDVSINNSHLESVKNIDKDGTTTEISFVAGKYTKKTADVKGNIAISPSELAEAVELINVAQAQGSDAMIDHIPVLQDVFDREIMNFRLQNSLPLWDVIELAATSKEFAANLSNYISDNNISEEEFAGIKEMKAKASFAR